MAPSPQPRPAVGRRRSSGGIRCGSDACNRGYVEKGFPILYPSEEYGFRATIEKPVLGGKGNVDVALERDDQRIGCEISISTDPVHELGNIQKCLAAGYDQVLVISSDRKHLRRIRDETEASLETALLNKVHFLPPDDLLAFFRSRAPQSQEKTGTVRGYKVVTTFNEMDKQEQELRRQAIAKILCHSMRQMK